jgi:hypothetical protein
MSVVLPFLLRLVRVICLVIFEATIVSPFATPQKTGKYFQDKRKIISPWLYFICISCEE